MNNIYENYLNALSECNSDIWALLLSMWLYKSTVSSIVYQDKSRISHKLLLLYIYFDFLRIILLFMLNNYLKSLKSVVWATSGCCLYDNTNRKNLWGWFRNANVFCNCSYVRSRCFTKNTSYFWYRIDFQKRRESLQNHTVS